MLHLPVSIIPLRRRRPSTPSLFTFPYRSLLSVDTDHRRRYFSPPRIAPLRISSPTFIIDAAAFHASSLISSLTPTVDAVVLHLPTSCYRPSLCQHRRRRNFHHPAAPPTTNITVYTNHRWLCVGHFKKVDIEARDVLRQREVRHLSPLSFATPRFRRSPKLRRRPSRGELTNARTFSAHIAPLEALTYHKQAVSGAYLVTETYAHCILSPSVPCGAPHLVILDASPSGHECDFSSPPTPARPRLAGKAASTHASSSRYVAVRSPLRRSSSSVRASTSTEWTDVARYDDRPPASSSSGAIHRRFRSRSPSERRRRENSSPAPSFHHPRRLQYERGASDSR